MSVVLFERPLLYLMKGTKARAKEQANRLGWVAYFENNELLSTHCYFSFFRSFAVLPTLYDRQIDAQHRMLTNLSTNYQESNNCRYYTCSISQTTIIFGVR